MNTANISAQRGARLRRDRRLGSPDLNATTSTEEKAV